MPSCCCLRSPCFYLVYCDSERDSISPGLQGYYNIFRCRVRESAVVSIYFYVSVAALYFYGMWLSSRIYLALIDRQIPRGQATQTVLEQVADASDPILFASEVLLMLSSLFFYCAASHGFFPMRRWMRFCFPLVFMPIFPIVAVADPDVGPSFLVAAINIAHIFFFALFWIALRFHGDFLGTEEGQAQLAEEERVEAELQNQEGKTVVGMGDF